MNAFFYPLHLSNKRFQSFKPSIRFWARDYRIKRLNVNVPGLSVGRGWLMGRLLHDSQFWELSRLYGHDRVYIDHSYLASFVLNCLTLGGGIYTKHHEIYASKRG